jgi:hypothetical protein
MVIDAASKTFSFRFAPDCVGEFGQCGEGVGDDPYLQDLVAQVSEVESSQAFGAGSLNVESLSTEFRALFSSPMRSNSRTPLRSDPPVSLCPS